MYNALIIVLLQPLGWRCVECAIHQERNVREKQHHIYVARTSNNRVIPMEWSWWAESYQPHSIAPNWGGARCHTGPEIQFCHHLAPPEKASIPKI